MASYARSICFFFLLVLSFSLQTQARDSKFFNKLSRGLTKNTNENKESISVSPTQSPSLAPAPAPESIVVEHGYGLYGDERYQYPPTTTDPVKSAGLREDKFVSLDEIRKNYYKGNGNGNGYVGEKQGMSDTRFMENGKYDYDVNQDVKDENSYKGNGIGNGDGYASEKQGMSEYAEDEDSYPENEELRNGKGNENVNEKQGMSDTRFLENGKYYHDINKDVNDRSSNFENQGNGNGNRNEFVNEKQEMSDNRFLDVDDNAKDESYLGNKRSWNGNGNRNGNGYVTEKQGMSDTRFLENGKYYYDVNQDMKNENSYLDNNRNAYGNGNGYVTEKQGMSDTRFLENGKYYHDIRNKNGNPNNNYNYNNNHENMASLNKNEYANGYNENDEHYNGNHGYVTEARGRYDYNPSEYVTEGSGGYYGNTKKLPNEYDTMEEYDKEQGYKEIPNEYVP